MTNITFRILEGLERGETFEFDFSPITIGREEENHIRLNDERVSRYHVKIQESEGKVFLTDLQSTNGTRVNGYPVHMHVLVPGDLINVGRCLLVYGSREQIQKTYAAPEDDSQTQDFDVEKTVASSVVSEGQHVVPIDQEEPFGNLFPTTIPPLPDALNGSQVAELSDLLSFVHSRLGLVIQTAQSISEEDHPGSEADENSDVRNNSQTEPAQYAVIPSEAWQHLLDVELQLADYIRNVSNPAN